MSDNKPRLEPIPVDEWDAPTRALFADLPNVLASPPNIIATFVHHPPLLAAWMGLANHVFSDNYTLPPHDRELVILRTGMRCNSSYELAQHVRIAHAMGMSDAELDQVREGPDAPGLAPFDALLLRAVDELHDRQLLTRATWDELARSYTERQLLDLVLTAGQYTLIAMAANSLEVADEGFLVE